MTISGQRRVRRRDAVLSVGLAVGLLFLAAQGSAAQSHWEEAAGTPQLVFGVHTEGLVSAPMLVVSLRGQDGKPMDFFLALPETVAAEVSRHIVRQAFDPAVVDDARMRALAALANLTPEDVGVMLAPLSHHNNLQAYLRNLKFALARVVREASRPSGQQVEAYYRVNGSGLRILTGIRIGKREFDFSPRKADTSLLLSLLEHRG